MTLSEAFIATQGTAVHVANQTRSDARSIVALCGKRFDRPVNHVDNQRSTCHRCCLLDDPFHTGSTPYDSMSWQEALTLKRARRSWRNALLTRDLVTPDGVITPRGLLLLQDFTNPTPWVDSLGIMHARLSSGERLRGACSANLLGIHATESVSSVNYSRLSRVREANKDAIVDCMTCATIVGRLP